MITFYGEPEQLPLPLNLPEPQFTRRALGILGELVTMREFGRAGYRAIKAPSGHGDVRLIDRQTGEITDVEVKTARRGKNGKWQFCLYRRLGRRVCTDHHKAQFVVLLAVIGGKTAISYVIPSDELHQQNITMKDPDNSPKFGRYKADLGRLEDSYAG